MKEYSIKVPGGMATIVLLNDDDAKRAGLLSDDGEIAATADPAKQPEAENKQPEAENKQPEAENKQAHATNQSGTSGTK